MDTSKVMQEGLEPDFVWDDYLEATQSKAAPPTAFSHVEISLVSNLKIGMKLEVLNPENENCYWVASVVMICGPLLSLRYLGYGDDRSADFWCDLKAGEFHQVGWCSENNRKLHPPKGVRDRHKNFMALIVPELAADTIPISLLEDPESGITPIDQIKPDMYVEIVDERKCSSVWPAKIIQNVGGRLLLRYECSSESGESDFWLFYLSNCLHPLGWAKEKGIVYMPPDGKNIVLAAEKWEEVLEAVFKEAEDFPFPAHVLEPQQSIVEHGFKERMKLELLNPLTHLDIRAATVTKRINSSYFIVEVDNLKTGDGHLSYPPVCCNALSLNIFPCNWAKEHGLDVIPPDGYAESDVKCLDWNKYLSSCKAIPAPAELFPKISQCVRFEVGMKLEAVNPFLPDEIHVATVENIVSPLLWIRMDSSDVTQSNHAVAYNSFDIFPVGWCASNAYPLETPSFTLPSSDQKPDGTSPKKRLDSSTQKEGSCGKSWCPKIYFNHCCFTGPYLSKSRLAELPQVIGPGPLHLVMKDVLTRLISIAYKSSRVLKELQICGKPDPNMLQQTIKAKYKGKSYRATVEFVRNSEQVDDFCRTICKKLDCCPHLFGPNHVGQDCPDNCYTLTKTKFGNGFMKRQKKINGSTSATDDAPEVKRGPGRRKKRKHWRIAQANASNDQGSEKQDNKEVPRSKDNSTPPKESSVKTSDSDDEVPAKKKEESVPFESKIVTRGAKLPNFGNDKPWKHHTATSPSFSHSHRPLGPNGLPLVRKKGRPLGSTKKAIAAALTNRRLAQQREREEACITTKSRVLQEAEQIGMPSNPLVWTVDDVVKYIRSTPCAPLAPILRDQEIDGQALLMLSLYSVQEFLHLKLEPAKVFCSLVEKLKYEFLVRS